MNTEVKMNTEENITIPKKYGFYSKKQEIHNKKLFEYYNTSGEKIKVSSVVSNMEGDGVNFDDKVLLGEVKQFIRGVYLF
jgi:hypothetical protein